MRINNKRKEVYNMKRHSLSELPYKIYKDNKEYRLVVIHNRGKYIAIDGSAINPFRKTKRLQRF